MAATKASSTRSTSSKKKKKPKFSINKLPQVAEGFSKGNEKREACNHCGLYRKCKTEPFSVPEVAPEWTGKLLLVTDPLAKESRKVMRRAWRKGGYADEDVEFLSPLRCHTHHKPSMGQIRACRPFLLKALEVLRPRFVLGLGATALRALTNKSDANITKARGKLITLTEKGKKDAVTEKSTD